MGLSRNSACLKIDNRQEQYNLAENCVGSRANDSIVKGHRLIARVCLLCGNQGVQKDTEEINENSV